jgi:CRISPR-associated protein Csx10
MKVLTFELNLLEPLLAKRLGGGDPNSAVAFAFVPGSMIRGMVISHYTRRYPADAMDATFRRLFLDGSVRFLNAYPETITGQRALPTPSSWRKVKDEEEPIYDFAVEVQNGNRQWQKAEQPFCHLWLSDEGSCKAELCKPDSHINIHTAREDRQRVTKGESTVFRYEALAPDQTLCGVILAEQEDDLATLKQWLPEGEAVSLGGSHLAGYGQAQLKQVRIQEDWREYTPVGDDADCIIVTLLSDALIRDRQTGAYVATLKPLLSCPYEAAFAGVRVVGGFNRKWNLPLQQTQAIQAGSVFVYPEDSAFLERLLELVVSGIGERRAEGFGRIAVNWHRAEKISLARKVRPSPSSMFTLSNGASAELARQMVERMLREQLDRALIAAANKWNIQDPPRNTQVSRMRIVARRALAQNNAEIITQHLERMKRAAGDQFRRARIGGERLDGWLRARAENVQGIWELVKVDRKPTMGGIQPEFSDALAFEYTVRLIDRVLHKAQKEAGNE